MNPEARSFRLSSATNLSFLGTRFIAKQFRISLEEALAAANSVVIDFSGVDVTQSFVDELLGPLVLELGEDFLKRIAFQSCSDSAQTIIRFVISNRLADYTILRQRFDP